MKSILYLDDTPDQRNLVRMILVAEGFNVDTAVDGQEGLRKVQEACPDLILLDLGMPKVDGFEFLEIMKQKPETAAIPVIVVSAWTSVKHREAAIEAGAATFISKPYDLEVLTKIVRQYLPTD